MNEQTDIPQIDAINIYREGQRSGFLVGVVVCVGVKYLWNRQKRIQQYESQNMRNA